MFSSVHEDLLNNGILEPLTSKIENMRNSEPGTRHFVAPNGSGSIPKYFLSKTGKESTMFGKQNFKYLKGGNFGGTLIRQFRHILVECIFGGSGKLLDLVGINFGGYPE